MPIPVHKMLMHGNKIIEALPISISESSEETIEFHYFQLININI